MFRTIPSWNVAFDMMHAYLIELYRYLCHTKLVTYIVSYKTRLTPHLIYPFFHLRFALKI